MSGRPEDQGEQKLGLAARIAHYFTELKYEWKKLTLPSRKELVQSTTVVFVFTLLVMFIISILDVIVSYIFVNFVLPAA